jgi:hypothetical protein
LENVALIRLSLRLMLLADWGLLDGDSALLPTLP